MPSATVNSDAPAAVPPILVDARGLACPLPALRLARIVRERGPGQYHLLHDDPAAMADIPALAGERGWTILDARPGRHLLFVPGDQAAAR
jgi:tRNA 2-thiouridine synthesizing protein A